MTQRETNTESQPLCKLTHKHTPINAPRPQYTEMRDTHKVKITSTLPRRRPAHELGNTEASPTTHAFPGPHSYQARAGAGVAESPPSSSCLAEEEPSASPNPGGGGACGSYLE